MKLLEVNSLEIKQHIGDLLRYEDYQEVDRDNPNEMLLIVHGCNAQGKFNSGVAKQVRQKCPNAYKAYMMNSKELGSFTRVRYNDAYIVNGITQEFYGYDGKRYTSYDAVVDLFESLAKQMQDDVHYHIAIPYKFASDRGGANWNIVYDIIYNILRTKSNVTLHIIKHEKATAWATNQ